MMVPVGTAGRSLFTEWQVRFPEGESHLHIYGQGLGAVEVNRPLEKTPRAFSRIGRRSVSRRRGAPWP